VCNENNFTLFFSFRLNRLVETICTNDEQWFGDILLNLQFDSTWKFGYRKKLSIAFITAEKKREIKMKNDRMYFNYILVYLFLEAYVLFLENSVCTYNILSTVRDANEPELIIQADFQRCLVDSLCAFQDFWLACGKCQ